LGEIIANWATGGGQKHGLCLATRGAAFGMSCCSLGTLGDTCSWATVRVLLAIFVEKKPGDADAESLLDAASAEWR